MEQWAEVCLQEIADIGVRNSLHRDVYLENNEIVTHTTLADCPIVSGGHPALEISQAHKRYDLYPSSTILVSLGRFSSGIGLLEVEAYAEKNICAIGVHSKYVFPEYVFHALRWQSLKRKERWSQGRLRDLIIFLPPLATQRHIIDFMSKIDSITQKHEKVISLASQYTRAQYGEMIEKGLYSQPVYTIGEVVEHIEVGRRLPRDLLPSGTFALKGTPTNYSRYRVSELANENGTDPAIFNSSVLAYPNDLLWYRRSDEHTAEPIIVHQGGRPIAISNDWIRLVPSSNKVVKEFLAKFLEVNYGNSKALFQYKNSQEITDIISQMRIAIPSLHDQQMFASVASMTDAIIVNSRVVLDKLQFLYEAKLDEFFSSNTSMKGVSFDR